ncbi:MAG: hypothetical protein IMZ55_18850, partial [Acidobacteria bacterium]|nr:hypothetical protein [Acidobacteriota bacterium]
GPMMTDLFKTGAEWLEAQRTAHLSAQVTYSRTAADASIDSCVFNATVGRTTFQSSDANGAIIEFVSRDFIFAAADLVLMAAGQNIEPQRGDRITDDTGAVYAVMIENSSAQPWRWNDPYGISYRVHTKKVTAATEP